MYIYSPHCAGEMKDTPRHRRARRDLKRFIPIKLIERNYKINATKLNCFGYNRKRGGPDTVQFIITSGRKNKIRGKDLSLRERTEEVRIV